MGHQKGFAALAVVGIVASIATLTSNYFGPQGTSLYSSNLSAEDMEFVKYTVKYGKSYGTK
jgi:hypothetical protein